MHGAIEGDGHAVRKIYVGHENKHFVPEVQAAHSNWRKKRGSKRLQKYWVGHVRLAALKQRNGPVVVCPLPLKLHPPGTAPGTERLQDLRSTNLDKHLTNKEKHAIAFGWCKELAEVDFRQEANGAQISCETQQT